ncbi:hypothetical protein FOZ62_013545, partial [Perkinsus olseni]
MKPGMILWSDKFADRAARGWMWRSVASVFRIPPKVLAWDVAEAFLTYKLTFIFHAPLELYIIVKWFKARRANLDEFMEESPKLLEMVEMVEISFGVALWGFSCLHSVQRQRQPRILKYAASLFGRFPPSLDAQSKERLHRPRCGPAGYDGIIVN